MRNLWNRYLQHLNVSFGWFKYEDPRLEISLFHLIKDDAIYFIYIQLYKLVFSVSFNTYEYREWTRAEHGIPT